MDYERGDWFIYFRFEFVIAITSFLMDGDVRATDSESILFSWRVHHAGWMSKSAAERAASVPGVTVVIVSLVVRLQLLRIVGIW